jgi:hypothetical protein
VAELFPLAGGVVVGAVLARRFSASTLWALIAVASIAIGVCATLISGEWLRSWDFLFVDIPEALVAALLGAALLRWAGRSTRRAHRST